MKASGGKVGSEHDPMLSSLDRLRLKLEREGKTLDDVTQTDAERLTVLEQLERLKKVQ